MKKDGGCGAWFFILHVAFCILHFRYLPLKAQNIKRQDDTANGESRMTDFACCRAAGMLPRFSAIQAHWLSSCSVVS
jgi:hypothetical protein